MRLGLRVVTAMLFVAVGVVHFTHPWVFEAIVPPLLPAPHALVLVSGAAEVAGGVGLLIPQTRRAAGWGLLALLVAVYPANVYTLVHNVYLPVEWLPQDRLSLWLRMPMQFVMAWFVWVSMNDEPPAGDRRKEHA